MYVGKFSTRTKCRKKTWNEHAKKKFQACFQDSQAQASPALPKYFEFLKVDQSRFYDFLPIGFAVLDETGIVKSANVFAAEMLGVEKNFLINTDFINFVYKEDQKIFRFDGNCLSELTHPSFDIRLKKKQGLFWARVNVLINENSWLNKRQISLIFSDINDLKQVGQEKIRLKRQLQQAQKLATIGVVSSGIVHDFNSILLPIIGSLEILIDATSRNRELQEALKNVLTSAKRAESLAQQTLSFSHTADHRVSLVKIQPIIWEVLQLISSTMPANIKIIHTIDKKCGPIMADSTQIYQVVMKLIANACHAMEDCNGILDIKLKEIEVTREVQDGLNLIPGTYACLSFAHTGDGIDVSTTNKIFDPYFTIKEKGTGLGLSDILNIVKNYGGDINFSSDPGKGNLYQVYIPRGYVFFDTSQIKYNK